MFQIHETYGPTRPLDKINGPVRIIDLVVFQSVVLINLDTEKESIPYFFDYAQWVDLLNEGALEKVADPFIRLTSAPSDLPKGASNRLEHVISVTSKISNVPNLFHSPGRLAIEIRAIAKSMSLSPRTVKRWVLAWLQAGRNPAAAVLGFTKFKRADENDTAAIGNQRAAQMRGRKRGVQKTKPETASDAPAHEVRNRCELAYSLYVKGQRMIWSDAYYEMLLALCGIPEAELKESKRGLLMDPVLIEKYRPPTWPQCRHVFRKLKKADSHQSGENPRGKRGKATDNVPGPGFFEIDATYFQIQLVSKVTKSKLVGRPTVYLIVDIFDGAIVGYAVTLENPSWAVAALALYNCFSDKGHTFARLGLPFTSKDWPCSHLPTMLRADRAELISDMGQDFPTSGVRVEITPSMVPIAKGTVEGKNSELKREHPGRFDLPGRFNKKRIRRESDGKKAAALDILQFERILVEIIMDINGEPIESKRIPPDAIHHGAKVASRIGFHEWALENRSGFTRTMGEHFVYEYLLTKAKSKVTPLGIKVKNELFNCDRLREMGYLLAAVNADISITVSFNPQYAGEVFFFDEEKNQWISAGNVDPEIDRYKMSFPEAKEFRSYQELIASQTGLNNHSRRRTRIPTVRKAIKDAVEEKAVLGLKTSTQNARIKENRRQEQADQRSSSLNGALPKVTESTAKTSAPELATPTNQPTVTDTKKPSSKALSLWGKVDAVNKH